VPLAGSAAACDPATGADEAVPPGATELASVAALAIAETAGAAGVAARVAALAALAAAALTCAAALAASVAGAAFDVEAGAAAEAAAATPAADAASAPDASNTGTVSTAPSRNRLGSWLMKAFGFASKSAREARASVALSCDCVTAIATSFSDCPGRTVT
jgi:hypothetical protein